MSPERVLLPQISSVGAFVFGIEFVQLICITVFLFLQSANYSVVEWRSSSALIAVGLSLAYLMIAAITNGLFFFSLRYEHSVFLLPYFFRQTVLTVACLSAPLFWNYIFWHCLLAALWHVVLTATIFGVYKYFVDYEDFLVKHTNHLEPHLYSQLSVQNTC
ncbi:hypothetical protein FO519_001654 [Halicephalobus sp. NKZ332]|nr:hypothetical protein FO519_001654 [Halicephalobus sp. NKZ332]